MNEELNAREDLLIEIEKLRERLAELERADAERVRAEAALRSEREQLLSIFDSIDEIIYVSDPITYEVLYGNRFGKEQLGKNPEGGICYKEFQGLEAPCDFCTNEIILRQKDKSYQWEYRNPVLSRDYMITDRIITWPDGRDVRFELAIDITDFKEAQRALHGSEERLELALQGANLGWWDWDVRTGATVFNERAAQMLGYLPAEIRPHFSSWKGSVHRDDLPRVMEALKAHLEGRTPFCEIEYRQRAKAGEWRWTLTLGKVWERDADDKPLRVVGTHLDITERKRAEEAISQNSRKYRALLDNAPVGIISVDRKGQILEVNRKLLEILESPSVEATKSINMLTFKGLVDMGISAIVRRCMEEDEVINAELPYTSKWGKHVYLRVMLKPMRDLNGEVHGCQAAVEDISERRQAEEELVRLATVVDQVSDTVLMTDTDGKIVYVNPAFERTCGYTREEVLGRSPHFLSSGRHDEAFYRQMWKTITSGKVWRGRLINKKKDGTLFEEEAAITPIKDESGEIVNYVAVKRDVTNEVALEKQLRQAQKMEAIGTLAGGIAHDFNNLLTIVLGFTELLLIDQSEEDPRYEDLQKISLTARHGGELVQRLLTFSRRAETKLRPLDLNDQVRQVKELLARTIPKMIKLELHLEADLKTIRGDPAQIEQLLLNLAVNAKDVMKEGGKLILETKNTLLDEEYCSRHLEVKPGEHVLLTVSDTGPGMAKEVVDRIFEPFYTTKVPGEGTGLGLAMVFGIVKSHGGHIDCQSEPGVGTVFRIYLPAAENGIELSPTLSGEMPAFGTETILVVDDEELVRELGRRLLSRVGYEVVTAATGREALELYRKHSTRISLVILDLMMPDMGGTECLEELLRIDPEAKILIASGYSPNGRTRDILEVGARGFVSKPFQAKQIFQMIRQILDKN